MVAVESDRPWARRGPSGEVRLNSWRNPSRRRDGTGRVTAVDPSTTKKRPKPIIAILAVAVPLVAIAIAAVATSSSSDDGAATATTISQSGDPAAAGGGTGSSGKGSGTTTSAGGTKGSDSGTGKTTTTKADPKAADEPDIPTDPVDAGPEGERTSVTYPQPTVPASGCSQPSGTAVITLGSKPSPSCLKLGMDQAVVVKNRTGKEISFVAISVNEVIAPGSEMRIGTASSAFGDGRSTFWSPGNPKLSGIVIVG